MSDEMFGYDYATQGEETQKTGLLRGGSLDGTRVLIEGVRLSQKLLREDGLWTETWQWHTDETGLTYGRFLGETKDPDLPPSESAPEVGDEEGYEAPGDRLHHAHLKDDNERRIKDIADHTQGQVKLDHAFDNVKMVVYLKHVLLELGVLERADFDYEGQRSKLLDITEREVAEFEEKAKAAMAQQKLGFGGAVMPPGGIPAGPRIIQR